MNSRIVKNILLAGMIIAAMIAELLFGSIGWTLPLVLPAFYFFTLNTTWYNAGFAAIFAGAVMDLTLGRSFPVSIPALLTMTLAAYQLRRKHPSELPEVFASILGAMAAAEVVYALFSTTEYGWGLVLQGMFLVLCSFVITLIFIQVGRLILDLLEIQDCFTPRSTLWKRRRLQNLSNRSPRQ